jgi:hypothetical protein
VRQRERGGPLVFLHFPLHIALRPLSSSYPHLSSSSNHYRFSPFSARFSYRPAWRHIPAFRHAIYSSTFPGWRSNHVSNEHLVAHCYVVQRSIFVHKKRNATNTRLRSKSPTFWGILCRRGLQKRVCHLWVSDSIHSAHSSNFLSH